MVLTRAGLPYARLRDVHLTRGVVEAEETAGHDGDGILHVVDVGK